MVLIKISLLELIQPSEFTQEWLGIICWWNVVLILLLPIRSSTGLKLHQGKGVVYTILSA